MASRRSELREYHLGVLLLIIVHELATVNCLPPSVVPSSPRTTKFTEISPKQMSRSFNVSQRKQNCSSFEFSKVSPSTVYPSTETRNSKIENETKTVNNGCSDGQRKGTECPRFVDTYSSFYLKIGGWLMLGIVLAGIIALVVTHYLGMRNMRRPRRRELSRILWVEALTKSKLARFV